MELFDEILVPLLLTLEEKDIGSRCDPPPAQQQKWPSHMDDEEVEKKSAPKQKCK